MDWAGRKHVASAEDIDKLDITRLHPSSTHLILFDSSDPETADITAIQMGQKGWLIDQDGNKHRCKLLGSKEFLDQKKKSRLQGSLSIKQSTDFAQLQKLQKQRRRDSGRTNRCNHRA